jgi:ribosomal protein S18 acetylase RimI-like enzyme
MAGSVSYTVRPLAAADRNWALGVVRGWGADYVVARGRKIYAAELPGFCAMSRTSERMGLATYEVIGTECQIVTLDACPSLAGIGTALVDAVHEAAKAEGCLRLWLITTNDNLDALRFYQRRGFQLVAVHRNSLAAARRLKPSIPLVGNFGIPLKDEIELEMLLSEPSA